MSSYLGDTTLERWCRQGAGSTLRFTESPLSFFRIDWDHEPLAVPRQMESADKSDALQTLRAVRRRPAVAKRLECVRLQRRFPKSGYDSMTGSVHGKSLSVGLEGIWPNGSHRLAHREFRSRHPSLDPRHFPAMSWFYRKLVRPALFSLDSEEIHNRTLDALGWLGRREVLREALASFYHPADLPIELFGLRFPNPVGLAAGMDKHAAAVPLWEALGFGFIELGAVTWHPQPGNPAPRMFRAESDAALINRMGFNNPGAEAIATRLAEWRASGRWPKHPVGINLGKSKVSPLEGAAEDYANSFRILGPHADFLVVNVSSPNTPNLRQLQDKAALDEILAALQEQQRRAGVHPPQCCYGGGVSPASESSSQPAGETPALHCAKPILVKVAPDLSFEALDEILELVEPRQIAGIVATNTTLTRPETSDSELKRIYAEAGGLSGRPLRARSTEIVRHLHRQTKGSLPIIGVGGIFNAEDAWEKITAGASLVQLYTGLVYEGPSVAKEIVGGLRRRLGEGGIAELAEVVGLHAKSFI
jgi:dihydroorotate dehydrogenase